MFNAGPDGLGLNSRGNWNEQLKQSVLGRQTAKGQCPAGLRGGKYDCLLSMKGPKNNSPGNQFPSHLLQTTGGLRKRGNMSEREWEREGWRGEERETLIYPFYPCCIFLPSFTAQTISTAECTGYKKTSAVDHDKQSASLPFVSLKTTELHE